jgi:hypothetical protein
VPDLHATEVDDLPVGPFHTHLDAVAIQHGAATVHGGDPLARRIKNGSPSDDYSLPIFDAAIMCPVDNVDHFSSSVR